MPIAPQNPTPQKTLWAWTIATFFGAGFGKPGPGTWGSVAAVLLWAAFALARSIPRPHALLARSRSSASSSPSPSAFPPPPSPPANAAAKIPASSSSTKSPASGSPCSSAPPTGSHGAHRPRPLSPLRYHQALSRPPLENLPEGWGIVFDDVAAGLYALGVASLCASAVASASISVSERPWHRGSSCLNPPLNPRSHRPIAAHRRRRAPPPRCPAAKSSCIGAHLGPHGLRRRPPCSSTAIRRTCS